MILPLEFEGSDPRFQQVLRTLIGWLGEACTGVTADARLVCPTSDRWLQRVRRRIESNLFVGPNALPGPVGVMLRFERLHAAP